MKKDLKSYERHDKDYVADKETYYTESAIVERTERLKTFKRSGFETALKFLAPLPKTHIDIGSGVGWIVVKMAPMFERSFGIEPSSAAIESAKKLAHDIDSVSFIHADMIDGMASLKPKDPVLITTSAVLSHIEDYYVAEFLKLVDNLPTGSKLFFSENYDRNIHWKFWHIRNKDWWRSHLPGWQLVFLDIENTGYNLGIVGIKVLPEELITNKKDSLFARFIWTTSLGYNLTIRALSKGIRYVTHLLGTRPGK